MNVSVRWHASSATKSIHPVLPPASAPLSPPKSQPLSLLFHHRTTETAKRWERDWRQGFSVFGKPWPVSRIICTNWTFPLKIAYVNKVTFLILLLEKLHTHCLSVRIGRQRPGCGIKPHLQICVKIHQSQKAFLFYTSLICVITLTKLT